MAATPHAAHLAPEEHLTPVHPVPDTPVMTEEPTEDLVPLVSTEDGDLPPDLADPPTNASLESPTLRQDVMTVIKMASPIAITYGSDFLIILIQMMFAGQYGPVALAAVALSASFCNVAGFSLGIGLLCALETLISQAFGAKQLHKVGIALHQSLFAMVVVTIAVCPLWMFAGQLLLLLGQDPDVVAYSELYIRVVWVALFPMFIYSTLRRYMQNQRIVLPSMYSGVFSVVVAAVSLSVMTYMNVGFLAIPLSQVITQIASALFFIALMKFQGLHKPTWVPFQWNYLCEMKTWVRLAVPGLLMVCAEWWNFEINIIVSGLLGADSLAAMALMYNMSTFLYTFPMSYSISAVTITGNAVGAKDIPRAKHMSRLMIGMTTLTQLILAVTLFEFQDLWIQLFTDDETVTGIVKRVMPLLCVLFVFDATQTTLGGVLRGVGKQSIGAATYLFAYYVVGMGLGIPLALKTSLGIMGQWIGITSASVFCCLILGTSYLCANWPKLVEEAEERLKDKQREASVDAGDVQVELDDLGWDPLDEDTTNPVVPLENSDSLPL